MSEQKHTPGPWIAICDDIDPPFVQYVADREEHERNAQNATAGNVSFTYISLAERDALRLQVAELRAVLESIEITSCSHCGGNGKEPRTKADACHICGGSGEVCSRPFSGDIRAALSRKGAA